MGVDYNVLIGPYIKATHSDKTKRYEPNNKKICTKSECSDNNHYSLTSQFCQQCGSLLTVKDVGGREIKEYFDCCEQGCENLIYSLYLPDEDAEYFFSNSGKVPGLSVDPKHDFGILLSEPIDAQHQLQSFAEVAAPAIDKLKVFYGADNVQVLWGVISYSN